MILKKKMDILFEMVFVVIMKWRVQPTCCRVVVVVFYFLFQGVKEILTTTP
jgi:hypothetical protein